MSLNAYWSLYSLDGTAVASDQVTQGDKLVVVIDGSTFLGSLVPETTQQLLNLGPLAARLETENPNLEQAPNISDLYRLGNVSKTRYHEAFDDHFVVSLDLEPVAEGVVRHFRVAYLVRAAAPGKCPVSPVEMEDMCWPHYRARGEDGWLKPRSRDVRALASL